MLCCPCYAMLYTLCTTFAQSNKHPAHPSNALIFAAGVDTIVRRAFVTNLTLSNRPFNVQPFCILILETLIAGCQVLTYCAVCHLTPCMLSMPSHAWKTDIFRPPFGHEHQDYKHLL